MSADPLFQPVMLGDLMLPNRIVMPPLTRHRADPATLAATALNATYYAQRATAGLIVAEASQISQQGQGYIHTPGIYTDAQVAGWRLVTDAVHAAGGRIFCQLWHVGRMSHVSLQPGGAAPVSASAIASTTHIYLESGFVQPSMPRALETQEIPGIVADFRRAAANAKRAGFDGVEVHGANGYLIDQFMRDGSNERTDAYGGAIENRLRFALEVVDAVVAEFGPGRVGMRVAPTSSEGNMADSNPQALFGTLLGQLDRRRLAYVHLIEGTGEGERDSYQAFDFAGAKRLFGGAVILNNGYTAESARAALAAGRADLVSFGRPFIANPDLPARFRAGAPLNTIDNATVYGGGARGYTDYPAL
ncbi:MAG: alkene reductase [Amaricoccus sp.]